MICEVHFALQINVLEIFRTGQNCNSREIVNYVGHWFLICFSLTVLLFVFNHFFPAGKSYFNLKTLKQEHADIAMNHCVSRNSGWCCKTSKTSDYVYSLSHNHCELSTCFPITVSVPIGTIEEIFLKLQAMLFDSFDESDRLC